MLILFSDSLSGCLVGDLELFDSKVGIPYDCVDVSVAKDKTDFFEGLVLSLWTPP